MTLLPTCCNLDLPFIVRGHLEKFSHSLDITKHLKQKENILNIGEGCSSQIFVSWYILSYADSDILISTVFHIHQKIPISASMWPGELGVLTCGPTRILHHFNTAQPQFAKLYQSLFGGDSIGTSTQTEVIPVHGVKPSLS